MNGNLLDGLNPVTQTIESGKALASFIGMNEELPVVIGLANGVRLVLSSKKDAYYIVTPRGCSCKGFTYHHTCKHIKGKWATGGNGPVMPEAVPRTPILATSLMPMHPSRLIGQALAAEASTGGVEHGPL